VILKIKYVLFALLAVTKLAAQINLVPNPSFEICDSICNRQLLGITHYVNGVPVYRPYLLNWFNAKATPDFMNYHNYIDSTGASGCWGGGGYRIPNSAWGV